MRKVWLAIAIGFALAPRAAHAMMTCLSSVDDFNSFMDTQLSSATSVTVSFTVTGVDLNDYFNGKGWLAELADTRCTGGGLASLKVYGNSDPVSTAHPPGTLKLEYGSMCCANQPCPVEYWANPMPGPQVFSQPSQVCSVTESLAPTTISYDVQCDGGPVFHADGQNYDAMTITRAAVLREVAGGHAMTNATATNVQVCYELGPPPAGFQVVPVMEDVTVTPQLPSSVYPDPTDLACGFGDGTAYLKFDLGGITGNVVSAKLFVHSASFSSATGTGADVDVVADTSWSESTLTWNARPALGARVGRIDGVTPDLWYSVDVSAGLSSPAKYAFALAPASTDTDTAHFLSKEASATLRAYLLVQTAPATGSDGGATTVLDAGLDPGPPATPDPRGRPSHAFAAGCSAGASSSSRDAGTVAGVLFALALIARRRRRCAWKC